MTTRKSIALVAGGAAALAIVAVAAAAVPNPATNLPQSISAACTTDSAGPSAACEIEAVAALDEARAETGLPPYLLPAAFLSQTPSIQMFILTNLDRVAFGLQAVAGLNSDLDTAAELGMKTDDDPSAPTDDYSWASNWAGDFPNALDAYYAWVYDDGLGSGNIDCTTANESGCWGHRENMFQFPDSPSVSLGQSVGLDNAGKNSYTQLFVDTPPGESYEYTWAQALALGVNTPGGTDLSVAARSSAKPVQQGTLVKIPVTVADVNGGTAPQIHLQITVPGADPVRSLDASAGLSCTSTTPTLVDCTQSVLFGPGTTASVVLTIAAKVVGQLPVSASVQYAYPDPVSANNTATAADAVVPGCTVPRVIGLSIKSATHLISQQHCRLIRTTFVATRSKKLAGRVVSQIPRAGVELIPGGGVKITVGRATKH